MSNIKPDRKNVILFSLLEGFFWSIMGSFGAYLVAWALSRGFAQSFVSFLLAIYYVTGFFGQFVLSSLCDRVRTNKKIFMAGVLAAGIAQLGMFFSDSKVLFALCYAGYGFFIGPMGSVLDAWMIRSFQGNMNAYSPARGVGSMGYAVIILVMGQLIGRFGYWLMPAVSTAMVCMTLVLTLFIPERKFEESIQEKKQAFISWKDGLSILRIPEFAVILATLFLISMASAPIVNFKILLLQSVGGNVGTQGVDSFSGCTVQFLVFLFAVFFTRIPARRRLLMSTWLVLLSILIDYSAVNCGMVIVGTVFMSVSYGLIMPAVREIAIQIIHPQFHTTAIGVMDAFYSFLGGAVAQTFAGSLIESMGIKGTVFVCMLLSVLPNCVLVFYNYVTSAKEIKRNKDSESARGNQ